MAGNMSFHSQNVCGEFKVSHCLTSATSSVVFDSQPEGLGVAFFATGPGLGLIMYIFTTLEFPTRDIDFHLVQKDLAYYTFCETSFC